MSTEKAMIMGYSKTDLEELSRTALDNLISFIFTTLNDV